MKLDLFGDFEPPLKKFSFVLGAILFATLLLRFAELALPAYAGKITSFAALGVEALALAIPVFLYPGARRPRVALFVYFAGMLAGDALVTTSYLFLFDNSLTALPYALADLSYLASCVGGTVFLSTLMNGGILAILLQRVSLLPFLIAFPLTIKILASLPPSTLSNPLLLSTEVLLLIASCLFFVINLAVVMGARSLPVSLFAAANSILVIVGWSIRLEAISTGAVAPGPYEFIWTFAILLAAATLLKRRTFDPIERFDRYSVLCQSKAFALGWAAVLISLTLVTTHIAAIRLEFVALLSALGIVGTVILSHYLVERLRGFCSTMGEMLCSKLAGCEVPAEGPTELQEISKLAAQRNVEDLKERLQIEKDMEIAEQIHTLSRQVAHDIRSPLAALKMAVGTLEESPAQRIVNSASERINAIANDLLTKGEKKAGASPRPLKSTVQALLTEKRAQFPRTAIFFTSPDSPDYSAFFESQGMNRVLSNLINNAVEALPPQGGRVDISIESSIDDQVVRLCVTDNGRGIPDDVLPALTHKGVSVGKSSGFGLGLYHARTTVESWGGKLVITSAVGKGTSVTLHLKTT